MPQLPAIGEEVVDAPGLPPIGGEVSAPDFTVENEKDAQGNAVVDSPLNLISGAASALNPLPAISAVGNALLPAKAGFTGPVKTIKQIGAAQGALFDKAKAAYGKGDYVTAARHFVDYLLPIVGPALDASADKMQTGQPYRGAGEAIGLGLSLFGPKALAEATVKVKGAGVTRNPAEAAAVEFGQARGIPVDAATATGNRVVRGVQHLADRSLGGGLLVAEQAERAKNAALMTTGERLATEVHPATVTAEQAGAEVKGALSGLIRDLHSQANEAYGRLRDIEAQTSADVPEPIEVTTVMKARMRSTLGANVPTQAELVEIRRMAEELKALPFTKEKLVADAEGIASDSHYVPRSAGAPVFHDIVQASGSTLSRSKVEKSLNAALETGIFNRAARGALDVARKRLAGRYDVSKPMLPPDAGVTLKEMALPVDVREVKTAIRPLYERLKRESELVPLHGGKAQTLVALDRLMTGPDHAPLSIADGALSDLKALARSDNPDLRSVAQGRAAFAVKQLDAAVRGAAERGGAAAVSALGEGRAATTAKYATAAVLDILHEEPVKTFRGLTAPKDSAVVHLRQVQELAPAAMPKIGRAVIEDMLATATEKGGFDHTDKLYADWQKLGPQTKQILFGSTTQELDKFFLLAKKLAENPNPSGSGHQALLGAQAVGVVLSPLTGLASQLGAAGLSALLHSPKGVRLLTRGLTLSLGRAPKAVQAAAWAEVVEAARAQGIGPALVPAAAGDQRAGTRAGTGR